MTLPLVRLLHLCDSLFPTGAFSHSDGLETVTAAGDIGTGVEFAPWLRTLRDRGLGDCEGPAVSRAWRAARSGEVEALMCLDAEMHAMRPAAASREASRAMGSRLLKTWRHMHPSARIVAGVPATLTLPVAFGVVCCEAGVAERDAVAGYMYTRLAASLSSAMRLIALGQNEGHALLARVLDEIPSVVERSLSSVEPLRAFVPGMDIAAMRHQHVHSRLFRS